MIAVSLAVVFAVVASVLAVLVVGEKGSADLDDLRAAAGRFGEALVSYDYHDPTAHRYAVLELATGSFRQDYEDAFDQGLADIITEVQAVSIGSVNDVYVTSIDDGQAQAIVSVDIEVSGLSGERSILDQYVLLTLVELDEGWRGGRGDGPELPDGWHGCASCDERHHDHDRRSVRDLGTLRPRSAPASQACPTGDRRAYDPGPSAPRHPPQ